MTKRSTYMITSMGLGRVRVEMGAASETIILIRNEGLTVQFLVTMRGMTKLTKSIMISIGEKMETSEPCQIKERVKTNGRSREDQTLSGKRLMAKPKPMLNNKLVIIVRNSSASRHLTNSMSSLTSRGKQLNLE